MGGFGGGGGERGPGVSQPQLDGKTLAAQFCPVPLVERMMVTVSQVNRHNSQQPCNGRAPLALREL
jgi:hypothetical protein